MKSKKNSLAKAFALVLAIICFDTMALTGCAKSDKSVDVTQMYIDKNEELGIDWKSIVTNLKEYDMEGSGFYVDKENLEEDVDEIFTISFTNYDPEKGGSFKDVAYQIMISYGVQAKNEFAYETPEFYDEPVYEIIVISNSSDEYYSARYNEKKEILFEDGEWILDIDRDETISDYINICGSAMGLLGYGE
ncbi:MAG: hypothetical protein UH239_07975 [Acutalibacteraceae bacterium]|nr:hypothetical protein [Acutalibacteraceae bacterium]